MTWSAVLAAAAIAVGVLAVWLVLGLMVGIVLGWIIHLRNKQVPRPDPTPRPPAPRSVAVRRVQAP